MHVDAFHHRQRGESVTFSIVARDAETGDLGCAVQSNFLAVGAAVVHARARHGAVATQALANLTYRPARSGLLLEAGATARGRGRARRLG